MAGEGEFDYFGTCWRSPQKCDQPSTDGDSQPNSSSSSSLNNYSTTISTSTSTTAIPSAAAAAFPAMTLLSTSAEPSTTTSVSSGTVRTNAFGISKTSSASSGSSSSFRSCTSSERERRVAQKGSSSSSGEHSVKGKTAKRGKTVNPKLRVLTFSDIENGFSCFGHSASSWADTLGELSADRLFSLSDQNETSFAWDETGGGAGKRTKISHPSPHAMTAWDIDGGLAADFDGSLSGLGTELGTSSYNMSKALLALPVFKQENLENGFQYILGAATSPAVKKNEETLTYLNQGQSYEIKVKKLGDLSEYQGKCFRSVLKVLFHERRLQYMEREQMELWKHARPGERILDLDIPVSYGLADIKLDSSKISQADFVWEPMKETGLYFKVNAISTEFTPKKHGGEKGVPFRIQIETYAHGEGEGELLHASSCQVKVFKPKGADRKHKTDREKMEKRTDSEKEKYQPSYECTVLTEVPLDQVVLSHNIFGLPESSSLLSSSFSELSCGTGQAVGTSPVSTSTTSASPVPTPSRQLSSSSPHPRTPGHHQPPPQHTQPHAHPLSHPQPHPSPHSLPHHHSQPHSQQPLSHPQPQQEQHQSLIHSSQQHGAASLSPAGDTTMALRGPLLPEATPSVVRHWLTLHRFSDYIYVFQHFSGADLLRLDRDDLIQICGLADGIRLNNAIQFRSIRPRLTIFLCQEPESVYQAVYMDHVDVVELRCKLAALFGLLTSHIGDIFILGPSAIHVLLTNEVLQNIQDQSRFAVEGTREESGDKYKLLLKTIQ